MSENNAPSQTTDTTAAPNEGNGNGEASPQLLELQTQLKDKENKYLYLYADFENYKKRAVKERSDAQKFGWESVARDLLLVLDNLERGLQYAPAGTDANLLAGLQMTAKQFRETLERQGVQIISAVGQVFNPELHEAVGQEPSDQSSGTIIKEEQKGYTLHGRLLRAARVIISSGPQN